MSRLNKTQNYAILWLSSQGMAIEAIAKELSVKENQISNFIKKNLENKKNDDDKQAIKTASSPVSKISSKNLMINQTASKNSRNVSIMTKEASSLNDSLKDSMISKTSRNNSAIFRPSEHNK